MTGVQTCALPIFTFVECPVRYRLASKNTCGQVDPSAAMLYYASFSMKRKTPAPKRHCLYRPQCGISTPDWLLSQHAPGWGVTWREHTLAHAHIACLPVRPSRHSRNCFPHVLGFKLIKASLSLTGLSLHLHLLFFPALRFVLRQGLI